MRLVIDLQACQTDSRDRGIGRYAMSLVQAVADELDTTDELFLAIDMADAGRSRKLRNQLHERQVHAKVVVYGYPTTQHTDASPAARKLAGQLRSRFYASLDPDVLLICSLFEYGTSYSTELDWTVLKNISTAVISYDLIPLLFSKHYLFKGEFYADWYQNRLNDLKRFDLVLSISEATKRDLVSQLGIANERISVINAGFDEALICPYDKEVGRRRLEELGIEKPFVLMVSNGDWRKNTIGALRAFADLPEMLQETHELVLTQAGSDVRQELEGDLSYLRNRVHMLGRVDDASLALLYRECQVLYFPSHYEGFGLPVLEAMAFNAPVLSSNSGALPEVLRDARVLFDPESQEQGVALLTQALSDPQFRKTICHGARERALGFTWGKTARKALGAMRALAERRNSERVLPALGWPSRQDINLMADACGEAGSDGEYALENGLYAIARAGKRRVLVDISEIVRLDAKTGIQRVTRNFLGGLASLSRDGRHFDVEPIRWTEQGMWYAREFARAKLAIPCEGSDDQVRVQPSDLVFMLDSSWLSPERFDDFHTHVYAAGGEVVWMVYDLIPVRFPETCGPGMPPAFEAWLSHAILTADGFVCISEATRRDLESFMDGVANLGERRPWTRSVHLGCDLDPTAVANTSDKGLVIRETIGNRPYFMALGTIEPRKDYQTIIDAFDLLWAQGLDIALVMVGRQGWNMETLVSKINQHPEIDRRLFWLQGASDGDVRYLLKGAAAFVQASIWEGFGLPLIEAGSLGVPLVVSDIAVFHEIAENGAAYFPVGDAAALADVALEALNGKPLQDSGTIRFRSWSEASSGLAVLLGVV